MEISKMLAQRLMGMGGEIITCQINRPARIEILNSDFLNGGLREDTEFGYFQIATGLRELGFDHVFDSDISADLYVMEEIFELINRIMEGGPFPLFSSFNPGWRDFLEEEFPNYLSNLSSCKSPPQMMGALIKEVWGKEMDYPVFNVEIVPTGAILENIEVDENIDVVLTTKEVIDLFKSNDILVSSLLEKEDYDTLLPSITNDESGRSKATIGIFSVIEDVINTTYEVITGEAIEPESIKFESVEGIEGLKEARINTGGIPVNFSFFRTDEGYFRSNGYSLLDMDYHYIDVMISENLENEIIELDEKHPKSFFMKSHENESVHLLYQEVFGEPGSSLANKLLHIEYN